MEQTAPLVILIALMGGGIAYIADKVGKHLGKKRLSLFGLRPRHTAAVGTILLGITITLFTLASIFALSSGVRMWVSVGPSYISKAKRELADQQDQIVQAKDQNGNLSNANKELTAKYGDIRKQLDQGATNLQAEQSKYHDLQGKTHDLQGTISSLNRQVGNENQQIRQLGGSVQSSEEKLKAVRAQEKQAELNRDTANTQKNEVQDKNAQLVDQNDGLMKQQAQLQKEITSLQGQRTSAQQDLKNSQNALGEAKRELTEIESQLGDVKLQLQGTLAKLQEANHEKEFYGQVSETALHERLIYSNGEEIARLPVRANLSQSAARSEITTLIRMARVDAQRKGARDADIYGHYDNNNTLIPAREIEQELAAKIAGVTAPQVLIACSSLNAFRTENASLEIVILPNPVVFSAGQMIAEALIDANKGDRVIVNEISTFLKDKVRPKALGEGLIAPINSDVSIGEVTIDDMLTLLQKIRGTTYRQVRLQAIAEGTTRAADSLRLTFRIR